MKKLLPLLPLLALIALAGCANFDAAVSTPDPIDTSDASVFEPVVPTDPAQPYETTMLACDATDDCAQRSVIRNAGNIMSIRGGDTSWVMIAESTCVDATCTATDESGGTWTLAQ